LVSVVVPCYNYGRYLPEAIKSVLDQPGVDVEVIIVDDASTDGSAQLALLAAEEDPRISVVLHARNMGHIATYNDGLSRATGDYVVLLSADDLLAPGSLARSTALMEEHPEVGLVYGYAREFQDIIPAVPEKRPSWSLWTGAEWTRAMCRRGTNIIVNPEAIMRRSVMDRLVGYRPDMPHSADMELWLRAADIAGVGRINGPVQAFYRVHGLNMHLTNFNGILADINARRHVFDELASVPGTLLNRRSSLVRRARRSIAVEAVRAAIQALDAGGTERSVATDLASFAMETDETIRKSMLWRAYVRRRSGRAPAIQRRLSAKVDNLRWSLRWRRWRRSGV
jgi:glycosyltransferase involved in cell wall biosynthesis